MAVPEATLFPCRRQKRTASDITGLRVGKLTVIGRNPSAYGWLCRCDCGSQRAYRWADLVDRRVVSCGCLRAYRGRRTRKPMIGRRFGKVVVIAEAGKEEGGQYTYQCRCDCGVEFVTRGRSLREGNTGSCGCRAPRSGLPKSQAAFRVLWRTYRDQATNRGYCFELTEAEFRQLIASPCFYCGLPPANRIKNKRGRGDCVYSGIDRVANSEGYTAGNCVAACATCNRAKRALSLEDFDAWVAKVYDHLQNRHERLCNPDRDARATPAVLGTADEATKSAAHFAGCGLRA